MLSMAESVAGDMPLETGAANGACQSLPMEPLKKKKPALMKGRLLIAGCAGPTGRRN